MQKVALIVLDCAPPERSCGTPGYRFRYIMLGRVIEAAAVVPPLG